MPRWAALEILSQTAGEVGMPEPTGLPSDSVQDSQMLAYLNSAGSELVWAYPWSYLTKTWQFNTTVGVDTYKVPGDWEYMLNQTAWSSGDNPALMRPQTPQGWNWLQNSDPGMSIRTRFRLQGDSVRLNPIPTDVFGVSVEYVSGNWVEVSGSTTSKVTRAEDTPFHDAWLLVKYVKLKWLGGKGLDTSSATRELTSLLNAMVGKDRAAPILSLAGTPTMKYLDSNSVPESSWRV